MGGDSETTDDRPRGAKREEPLRITGGRYRVGRQLGEGGMGEVLEARDEQIGRDVAIKRIRDAAPSERAVTRFMREATIQGRLEHPAIPPVHELGRDVDGLPYFAMKKLSGTTLSAILDAPERFPQFGRQRMLRAFVDVCLAVELAHVNGVIHRDLKPSNIMLGGFGEVYVLDWGVAKVIGEADDFDDLPGGEGLTAAGSVIGTPGYMAPEQSGASDVDARADVFSLGRVLAEILEREPVPELGVLAERATEFDRSERISTARELGEAVQAFIDGDRDLALRRQLAHVELERATGALQGGSIAARQEAMHHAGRALALDPSDDAASMVLQLLVEPPAQVPPEVRRELDAEALEWVRTTSRISAWGYASALVIAPPIMFINNSVTEGIVLLVTIALAIAVLARTSVVVRSPSPWVFAMTNTIVLVVLARLFSPMLLAPGLACVTALVLLLNPFIHSWRSSAFVFLAFAIAIIGPLLGEQLGLLSHTFEVLPEGLVVRPSGLGTGSVQVVVVMISFVAALGVAVLTGNRMRENDKQLREKLHTMTWHLKQLLPQPQRE